MCLNGEITMKDEVQERLKQIAAAMAAKKPKAKPATNVSCPVDPAERALCEGCQ